MENKPIDTSWEDLKRIKEKREAEAKNNPEKYYKPKKIIPPKKRQPNINKLRIDTIQRLWAFRNKGYFEIKEIMITKQSKTECHHTLAI